MSGTFRTKLVGVTFQNPDGTNRQDIIIRCEVGEHVLLKRDYDNSHDPYAIAVLRRSGEQIGFIAKDVAFSLAPHLDQGGKVTAQIVDLIGGERSNWGCVIEIEVGSTPYQVKEAEARELRDRAKSLEQTDLWEAIRLYRQSMMKLLEVDTLIRETYAFKRQIIELGKDLGTWRRTSFPIERITALIEKDKNYTECLAEIENYERMGDKKGLGQTDIRAISKRKARITKIDSSIKQE